MYFFGVVLLLCPCVLMEKTVKTELLGILKFLPHIQIILTPSEGSGDLLDFVLQEQKVVSIFVGNTSFSKNKIFTSKFEDAEEKLSNFVQLQSATYIHIIEDAVNIQALEDYSRQIWDKRRIKKLYFLTKVGLFAYNPFKDNGHLYSLIESDHRKTYLNLHGFPMRVQIFRSVYAFPVLNQTGSIQKVFGPDGNAAQVLQQKMNFSMVFKKPNEHFFG